MSDKTTILTEGRDLVLSRFFDCAPEIVYRAWTDPELIKKWFAPAPWTTPDAKLDVRPGGSSLITMRSPDGQDMPCSGMFLEAVPNKRLVFTDAYSGDWEPSEHPFMTVVLTFEPVDGKTLYTERVRHWSVADREKHEQMGFHVGWVQCAEQLAAIVEGS